MPRERVANKRQKSDEQPDTEGNRDGECERGSIDLNLFEPRDADARVKSPRARLVPSVRSNDTVPSANSIPAAPPNVARSRVSVST